MTFVTSERTYNFSRTFTIVYSLLCESTVMQPVIQPLFSKERGLPLGCWYPFDELVSVKSSMF